MSNKCNFPAIYKDKKVSPAKDTRDDVSTSFWTFEVYRTARMTAWKTSEAIIKDVEVRLVTYRHGRKTKGRIDRPRVWIAATKKI